LRNRFKDFFIRFFGVIMSIAERIKKGYKRSPPEVPPDAKVEVHWGVRCWVWRDEKGHLWAKPIPPDSWEKMTW